MHTTHTSNRQQQDKYLCESVLFYGCIHSAIDLGISSPRYNEHRPLRNSNYLVSKYIAGESTPYCGNTSNIIPYYYYLLLKLRVSSDRAGRSWTSM